MKHHSTEIKICGITNEADARGAAKAGVDYLGFIQVPESPRYTLPETARDIVAMLKKEFPKIRTVGVFLDAPRETVASVAHAVGFDCLQFHGLESVAYCENFIDEYEVWKVFIVKKKSDLDPITSYRGQVQKIMIDAGRGSGGTVDWRLLDGIMIDVLAGGLHPENVVEAIQCVWPQIVDMNSGVEIAPGKKDIEKILAAVAAVHSLQTNL